MSKTKPRRQLSARQIQEDVEFYNALKKLPPEELDRLGIDMVAVTAAFEETAAAQEAERQAFEAMVAIQKEIHDAHIAVCDARIADLTGFRPSPAEDDDDESPAASPFGDGGGASRLH